MSLFAQKEATIDTQQRIIVTIIIQQNGKLLMIQEGKEKIRGLWNPPTGHVEYGENIITAAIREAGEETGLDVVPTCLLGIENYLGGERDHIIKFIFLADTSGGTIHTDGAEILATQWMAVEEIRNMPDKLRKPKTMELVLKRLATGASYPLDLIKDYL